MRTNADCTLYARSIVNRVETWTRTHIRAVAWNNRKAANVIKSGMLEADSAAIYIPMAGRTSLVIKPGDVLVRGLVNDEISAAYTMTALRSTYSDVVTVTSVDRMDQGNPALHHWQIGGK
jgi:hypothetical protein